MILEFLFTQGMLLINIVFDKDRTVVPTTTIDNDKIIVTITMQEISPTHINDVAFAPVEEQQLQLKVSLRRSIRERRLTNFKRL